MNAANPEAEVKVLQGHTKNLENVSPDLYGWSGNPRYPSVFNGIYGDADGLRGEVHPNLEGDVRRLTGNVTGIWGAISPDLGGDITGLREDITGLRGDFTHVGRLVQELFDELRSELVPLNFTAVDGAEKNRTYFTAHRGSLRRLEMSVRLDYRGTTCSVAVSLKTRMRRVPWQALVGHRLTLTSPYDLKDHHERTFFVDDDRRGVRAQLDLPRGTPYDFGLVLVSKEEV